MESFVDVTYHGIEVGRRVKLTEVAPDAGYLEVAAPMPVGTTLELAIDGGIAITAIVRGVHEQVGGSDRPPGMRIKPTLAGEPATRWWAERVTEIASGAPPSRRTHELTATEDAGARAAAERARADSGAPPFIDGRKTRQMEPEEIQAAVSSARAEEQKLGIARQVLITPTDGVPSQHVEEDGLVDDGKRTEVMAAVDPEILARLTGSGDMPLIDDGRRTLIMEVPPVMDDDADDTDDGDDDGATNGNGNGNAEDLAPSASGRLPAARAKGKRKRRRR